MPPKGRPVTLYPPVARKEEGLSVEEFGLVGWRILITLFLLATRNAAQKLMGIPLRGVKARSARHGARQETGRPDGQRGR